MVIVADAIAVAVVGDDLGKCGEYIMFGDIPKGKTCKLLKPFNILKNHSEILLKI